MNALEMKEWRKVRKKKCNVAPLNDKLVVDARVIYNRKVLGQDEEVEEYKCRHTD